MCIMEAGSLQVSLNFGELTYGIQLERGPPFVLWRHPYHSWNHFMVSIVWIMDANNISILLLWSVVCC